MNQRTVADVMKGSLLAVARDVSVEEVALLMAEAKVGSAVIMAGAVVVGICTERDILCKVVATARDPSQVAVSDIMTPNPTSVHPSAPFIHAIMLMQEGNFRHLPVIQDGKLVGIVSSRDAMPHELFAGAETMMYLTALTEAL